MARSLRVRKRVHNSSRRQKQGTEGSRGHVAISRHQWAPVGGRSGRQPRCAGLSNRNGCNSPKNFLRPAPRDKGYQRMSRGMKQRFPVGDVSSV